jgi:hypothetical protein
VAHNNDTNSSSMQQLSFSPNPFHVSLFGCCK